MADIRYKFVHTGDRSHIWQIDAKERDSGRLTHRQQAEKLVGRKIRVQDGDVLGIILRKEREGHVPEHLLVEPYFGSQMPHELLAYLEQHFPGAQAIVSHHSHPKTEKEASWIPQQSAPDAAAWAREHLSADIETGWLSRLKRVF